MLTQPPKGTSAKSSRFFFSCISQTNPKSPLMPCINYGLPVHLSAAHYITLLLFKWQIKNTLPVTFQKLRWFFSLILYLFRVFPSLPLLPCSLCPYCLTDPGLSSFFPPQRSGSGAGALRETAAVQSEEVQFFPLRLGSVRQTGSARRDRTDSFCGLCGEGESKRRFLEMPRKMIFFPPSSSQNLGKRTCAKRVLIWTEDRKNVFTLKLINTKSISLNSIIIIIIICDYIIKSRCHNLKLCITI